MEGQYEREEYLEQDDEEADTAGRRKSLLALAVLAVLVIGGILLVARLHDVARLQDCLMTHVANCSEITVPSGAGR
jgi:hypothetical protein